MRAPDAAYYDQMIKSPGPPRKIFKGLFASAAVDPVLSYMTDDEFKVEVAEGLPALAGGGGASSSSGGGASMREPAQAQEVLLPIANRDAPQEVIEIQDSQEG